MPKINIVALQPINAGDRARIEAIDSRVSLRDLGGWFDGEYRDTWPAFTTSRYLAAGAAGIGTRAERDLILAEADIIIGGWPFPLDLRARASKLKWFHQRPAGSSNLLRGDLWQSDVLVTTSRGVANALAIAEYAMAGLQYFAKGLQRAGIDRQAAAFDARAYRPLLLTGKTACVVGAGGIGREVGRLCAAAGMRVVGTSRQAAPAPPGFAELGGPQNLDRYLSQSEAVLICCQWTPQTTRLFDDGRFAAMKPGSILVNIARGEIIDETALLAALARDHLRGVVLDVYVGEFDHIPPPALWSHPNVMITPHISGLSDQDRHGAMDLFCENLAAWLNGAPLRNVVDWERGY